jgi:hypothetical protein
MLKITGGFVEMHSNQRDWKPFCEVWKIKSGFGTLDLFLPAEEGCSVTLCLCEFSQTEFSI